MTVVDPGTPLATSGVGSNWREGVRPDVPPKIDGSFEYSNDCRVDGMLFGATVRSPHAHARLLDLDIHTHTDKDLVRVFTIADVASGARTGHITPDQPPFVDGIARYEGEPVAFVVARSQDAAWRLARAITAGLKWEILKPLTDPLEALDDTAVEVHPHGNLIRELNLKQGPDPGEAEVVVEGTWSTGRQDQAFLGVESALARPDIDGGVTLTLATQDLHTDQHQIAGVLGLPLDKVRLVMSGIGGAFGGREDITCQVHLAMAALTLGRAVSTTYRRDESFLAHPKRHPSQWRYRLGADAHGIFSFVDIEVVLDGGPYASTSGPVLGSACYFAAGPYRIPSVRVNGKAVRTNNPVSGAMRGFGAVQACFAMESTVDVMAHRLGLDPVELRRRNVLRPGDRFPTSGQVVTDSAPLHELIDVCEAVAPPEPPPLEHPLDTAGGTGLACVARPGRRGTGFALGVKNHLYGEGTPEWSCASLVASSSGIVVRSAAAEVGQGIMGVLADVASKELGGMTVLVEAPSTAMGYAGSSSASRQTWMSGAAVQQAARLLAERLRDRAARRWGCEASHVELCQTGVRRQLGERLEQLSLAELLGDDVEEGDAVYRAPTTQPGAPETGAGDVHVSWMFVAQRATVDVDLELGLCRVVQVATAQDVGRALNPVEVVGQIRGAVAQGIGLALTEELVADRGRVMNASFTDYLLPTTADVPQLPVALLERGDPVSPLGIKGVGEPGSLASTAAIAAAIRDATGRAITHVPVRPEAIVDTSPPPG